MYKLSLIKGLMMMGQFAVKQDRFDLKYIYTSVYLEEEMATTAVFLSGEFYGQRSMAGYSPWCCKELDTSE